MKKFVFLLFVVVFAVSLAPASAAPADRFGDLAAYFPADSPMFFSIRTDEAFFDKVDDLVQLVAGKFPGILPADLSVRMLYDAPLGSVEQAVTIRADIRPWLGGAAAVGFTGTMQSMMEMRVPPVVIALEITDRAAAEAFVERMLGENLGDDDDAVIEKTSINDYTVYQPTEAYDYIQTTVAIGNSVLFYAPSADVMPLTRPEEGLPDSPGFQDMTGLLPAEDYDALVYIDTPAIADMSMRMTFGNAPRPDMAYMMNLMQALYDAAGPQMVGLTLLDTRALVVDSVQLRGDTSRLEALGLVLDYPASPVDTAFAANVPADAPFVMQGTSLGPAILSGLQNFRAIGDWLQQEGLLGRLLEQRGAPDAYVEMANNFNLKHLLTFGELAFSGMTGLNLQNDVLAWMTGDYAGYLRLLPSETLPLLVDLVLVVEAADPAAAQHVIDQLASALDQYEFAYERVDEGTLAFTSPLRLLFPRERRAPFMAARELDVLVGTNGSVFALGTRPGVEVSLNARGDGGLASDPAYTAAQAYFLSGAESLGYMNPRPLFPLIRQLAETRDSRDLLLAIPFLSLLESASISAVSADAGVVSRFALTLSDQPLEGFEELQSSLMPRETPPPTLPTPTFVPTPTASATATP